MRHATLLVGLLVWLALLPGGIAVAQAPAPSLGLDPETLHKLEAYMRDPRGSRAGVMSLGRQGTADLPLPVVLALADAQLRGGRPSAAAQLFGEVLARGPAAPWDTWAELGLAWATLSAGDVGAARDHYARVAARDGQAQVDARVMVALLDAGRGRTAGTVETLDRIASDPATPPAVGVPSSLVAGYARYWSGDAAGAARAFTAVADADPTGPLADDARYAAARARWRSGDRAGALAALHDLVGDATGDMSVDPRTGGLVDLDPRAVLHASVRRYRRAPLAAGGAHLVRLLDGDGVALGRLLLRRLAADGSAPPAPAVRQVAAPAASGEFAAVPSRAAAPASSPARPGSGPPTRAASDGGDWPRIALMVVLAVLVISVLWRPSGRRAPRP